MAGRKTYTCPVQLFVFRPHLLDPIPQFQNPLIITMCIILAPSNQQRVEPLQLLLAR